MHPIRLWLRDHDLTQTRLANEAGLSGQFLSNYLSGARGLSAQSVTRIVAATVRLAPRSPLTAGHVLGLESYSSDVCCEHSTRRRDAQENAPAPVRRSAS